MSVPVTAANPDRKISGGSPFAAVAKQLKQQRLSLPAMRNMRNVIDSHLQHLPHFSHIRGKKLHFPRLDTCAYRISAAAAAAAN
jgi:hypothetical protein